MGKNQLSIDMESAYQKLAPSKVLAVEFSPNMRRLFIVSEAFKGKSLTERMALLNDTLKQEKPLLFKESVYIFEPFTKEEVLAKGVSAENEIIDLISTVEKAAASSIQGETLST